MNPTNLYEYYKAQGKTLPSVQERTGAATQAGITGYAGTADQNIQLLKFLQGGAGAPTPPATSVTPAPGTPATPAQVYKDLGALPTGSVDSPETIAARKAVENNLLSLEEPDENKIYQNTLTRFQAEIDAQNRIYADELERAKVAGGGRLGSQTAINARRGGLGSDFGEAQYQGQEQANEKVYKSIENEKAAKISSILSQARTDASAEIKAKRDAYVSGLDARLAYYNSADERKATNSGKAIQSLISKGISPSEVDPTQLKQLAGYYGVSVDDIMTGYDTAKKQADSEAGAADLEARKSEADIKKIESDIAKGKIIELSEGGMLYNTETGETFKNPKTFAPSSGSGNGSSGGIYDQLDYRTANAVIAQGNSFGTSDVVKKYNNIVAASNLIAGVDPATKNPAEHQAVIYNFAKALDPDSVVREGEYATVKKYSQSLLNKYGGEIKQAIAGTGFLSPGAIKAIQEATDNRIKAYEPQYQNLRSETKNRINSIAGKDVADIVLLDYEQGYTGNQQGGGGGNNNPDPLGLFE